MLYFGDSYIDYKVSKAIKSDFVFINGYSDDKKLYKYKSIYKYKNFLDFLNKNSLAPNFFFLRISREMINYSL